MNTVRLNNKYLTLLCCMILFSCSVDIPEEGEYLKWTTTIELPIFKDYVTLETLADDSLITIDSLSGYFDDGVDTDSIFVYRREINIEKVEVGNKLKIDPISTEFSQSVDDVTVEGIQKNISSAIGRISLNDIDPSTTEPFVFREIYPEIENVENGISASIDSFEITPIVKPFSFDDFGYAEFSMGELNISIINNMVITLGPPITITLLEISESDTIEIPNTTIQFDNMINAENGFASGTLDLAGVTLPGEILVQVSGNSLGTSGITIPIDEDAKNSAFTIEISGSGLEVVSASAKIPEQVIEENGSISLEPDSNKIVRATIDNGNLIVRVDNYIGLSNVLNLTIPNLQDPNGNQYTTVIDILANTENINDITNMENYSLVMDPSDQSIAYNYNVLTIDSGDELVPITDSDSIVVQILLEGTESGSDITFTEFQGYLNQSAMEDSSTIELETETRVDHAILNSGELRLSITNGIGIEAVVNFSIAELSKNGELLDTSFQISNDPLEVSLNLAGYLLDLDTGSNPQRIHYYSVIDIPSEEEMTLTFGESILIDVYIDTLYFSELSGYVEPVVVDIDPVEQNIDLPEELDNLDFAIIQMDFDFRSSITLPVLLDLELKSYNDDTGDSAIRVLNGINITDTPFFSIDSAEQLINIKPDRIVATGNAEVGSLDVFGSVSVSDSLSGDLTIAAPLAFEIDSDSKIELDHQEFESMDTEDVNKVKLFIDYENDLELGADVVLLVAIDTTFFDNGTSDTLIQLTIGGSASNLDSIIIEESSFDLLSREGNYSKAILKLLGRNQEEGPTRFLSTDTMKFDIYLNTEVIIDPINSE